MRTFPDVRLPRAVLGNAIRRTELHGLSTRTSRRPRTRVPPAPAHVADVSGNESGPEPAAVAPEIAGAPVDACRIISRVSRRARDPYAPRPAPFCRVAREHHLS